MMTRFCSPRICRAVRSTLRGLCSRWTIAIEQGIVAGKKGNRLGLGTGRQAAESSRLPLQFDVARS